MSNNSKRIMTTPMTVRFAWLHAPDTKFEPNFSVTVPLSDELKKQMSTTAKGLGGTKVNGVRDFTNNETGESEKVAKFTNRILIEKNNARSFPCVDSNNKPTSQYAMGGDEVRLLLTAKKLDRDGSVSFFLEGVQIIAKNASGGGGGFDAYEGGFVDDGSAPAEEDAPSFDDAPAAAEEAPEVPEPAVDDDDLPF